MYSQGFSFCVPTKEKNITTPKSNRLNVSCSFSAACSHKLAKPTICLETGNASSLGLHKSLSAKLRSLIILSF